MRGLLLSERRRRVAAALLAAAISAPGLGRAAITPSGDVAPTYNGFSDPWFAGFATIGSSGVGSVTVDGGSDVDAFDTIIGRFPSGDGIVTVAGFGSTWDSSGDLHVGDEGVGDLVVEEGGAVTSDRGLVGVAPNSFGRATLRDIGSSWTLSGGLEVGVEGVGVLFALDGAVVEAQDVSIGDRDGSQGAVTVDGASSRLVSDFDLNVGLLGTGSLNIRNSAVVDVDSDTRVTRSVDEPGAINFMTGGTLNTGNLYAAPHQLQGDGVVNTGGLVSDVDLVFDAARGLQQQVVLNGAPGQNVVINLDANATPRDYGVGYLGASTLSVSDGRRLPSDRGFLGFEAGSNGTATVAGAGSGWDLQSLLTVGFNGEGSLDVTGGATVTSFSGIVGFLAGSTGSATVSGAGSAWETVDAVEVGAQGTGELRIEQGGRVTGGSAFLGTLAGASGTATVTGVGSVWETTTSLVLGAAGQGSLTIADGGRVEAAGIVITGALAGGAGSIHFDGGVLDAGGVAASPTELTGVGVIDTGTLLSDVDLVFDALNGLQRQIVLDDLPGQQVTINLDLTDPGALGGPLGAGYRGEGSLRIADGLTVSSGFGSFGLLAGSNGVGTVSGAGTRWESGDLGVGDGGRGSLRVDDGAIVVSSLASVGGMSGAEGEATVSGAGSRWEVAGALEVADAGTGVLTVEAGGFVSSGSGIVGFRSGAVGEATVVGPGSMWETTGDLDVGSGGRGALSIADGALVKVGGEMEVERTSASAPSDVFLTTGGRLALPGDENDAELFFFLSIGVDTGLNFWDGAQWVDLADGVEGVDYTLEEQTTGDLAGFTLLTVGTPVDLPGDYNGDGLVDAGDFVAYREQFGQPTTLANDVYGGDVDERRLAVWAANYGRTTPGQLGDFNGDDLADVRDYLAIRELGLGASAYAVWAANYGAGVGPAAVPEPAAGLLAVVGLFMGCDRRRRYFCSSSLSLRVTIRR